MESLGPLSAPQPIRGGELPSSWPVADEAEKVVELKPVPRQGVPKGHPNSLPVQDVHQVSLGGTARAQREENIALPIIGQIGRSLGAYRAGA